MNLQTFDNITKLFAISINKNIETDIQIVKKEYQNFINAKIEEKYIENFSSLFEKYLNEFSSFKSPKKLSLNSVRLISICDEIKNNLPIAERLIIIFELLILIRKIENNELCIEFIKTISEILALSNDVFQNIFDFVLSDNQLIYKTLFVENLQIATYCIIEHQNLILIKSQSDFLKINNNEIKNENFSIFQINDIITYKTAHKIYFCDLTEDDKINIPKFSLNIENLEIKVKNKILLHNFSCEFRSGEFVGIIGKSGSGKTTLQKTLAGNNKNFDGTIKIDKENCIRGFVAQQNSFVPLFSVEEHLQQRADFLNIKTQNREKIIENVLNKVGLKNDRKKIAIRSDNSNFQLSGGQQKRLAIAMELLTEPDIFLLDEPTSGLASNDALNIISLLKSISKENKIVVASIHQPDYEMFMKFDKILIIDEGGYPIYFGTPTNSIAYFREIFGRIDKNSMLETYFNPSVLLNLIDEQKINDFGEKIEERIKNAKELYEFSIENRQQKAENREDKKEKKNIKNTNQKIGFSGKIFFKSFWNQLKFSFAVDLKNKTRLLIFLLLPLIISVLVSVLTRFSTTENYEFFYNKNLPIWILMLLISAVFIGLVSSAHEFINLRYFHKLENLIINKKKAENSAKIIKYLIFSAIQSVFLVASAVIIIKAEFHIIYLFSIVWILIFWGNLVSMILSKIFRTTTIIYLLIPLIVIPQMIFSGGLIPFSNFNKNYPKYCEMPIGSSFIPIRWASEATITKFFIDNQYNKNLYFDKVLFYEADFELKYILPKIKEIYLQDSVLARILIANEFENLYNKQLSFNKNGENIEKYYKNIVLFQQNEIENKISRLDKSLKIKQTNFEIDNIVLNYSKSNGYDIENNIILRKYLPIYNQSKTFKENFNFLTGIKKFGKNYLFTYHYNLVILLIYNLLLIVLLFFIKEKD